MRVFEPRTVQAARGGRTRLCTRERLHVLRDVISCRLDSISSVFNAVAFVSNLNLAEMAD